MLVAGIGIAPCDGDVPAHRGGNLFALFNELDVLADEHKNGGVVMAAGELLRNPFTAGFIMVPQDHIWQATKDLAATQRRANQEIAALLTSDRNTHRWELLRMLNWVAAPSTQHSAARTHWGPRWIHMLGYADTAVAGAAIGPDLRQRLGLLPGYSPEFLELRVSSLDDTRVTSVTRDLQQALQPHVAPSDVAGGRGGSVQFTLPCISKSQLSGLADWRAAYARERFDEKLLDHSLLLEPGVLLSEPSTRIAGMAEASLWGGESWVAVPFADLLADPEPIHSSPALESLREAV